MRYATYLVALPLLMAGLCSSVLAVQLAAALALLTGVAAYTRMPYRRLGRLWQGLSLLEKLQAIVLVPVIRVVGDVAKMLGYPAGVWWRFRRRPAHAQASSVRQRG